jgi:hypothetical protein
MVGLIPEEHCAQIEAFMEAGTDWIDEPEFVSAFQELTGEAPMQDQAAWTGATHPYPAFLNVTAVAHDTLQVTARTAESQEVSRFCMPLEDWHQLVADVSRLRFPAPAMPDNAKEDFHPADAEAHATIEGETFGQSDVDYLQGELNAAVENGTSNGATADDPLAQRGGRPAPARAADTAEVSDLGGDNGSGAGDDPDANIYPTSDRSS